MNINLLLLVISVLGCMHQESKIEKDDEPWIEKNNQAWICNNKESEHHNLACHEDCYERGDLYKFCWLLEKKFCSESGLPQDLQEACLIFEN